MSLPKLAFRSDLSFEDDLGRISVASLQNNDLLIEGKNHDRTIFGKCPVVFSES